MNLDSTIQQLEVLKKSSHNGGQTQVQFQGNDGTWYPVNSIATQGTGSQEFIGMSTQQYATMPTGQQGQKY